MYPRYSPSLTTRLIRSKAAIIPGAEYIGAHRCTLDAFLESIDTLPQKRGWDLDKAVDTVVNFWLNHGSQVKRWQKRLDDAGTESVVVGRLATMQSLRSELESLLDKEP